MKTFHLVNNTGETFPQAIKDSVAESVREGKPLHPNLADIFVLKCLKAYNPDGSDRYILDWGAGSAKRRRMP
jgi:hypothetical protein